LTLRLQIALHPLLVRCRYNDEQLQRMVALATKHGLFGGQCTLDRVSKEMAGWNDYNLHTFARESAGD
jgi:SWI/SNF-related matrix-associated actin-dependent regulator 1 of chromatin subfamily A